MPTFNELAHALNKTKLKMHPSQAHGLITGIICGNIKTDAAWEALITGSENSTKAKAILDDLYQETQKQLQDFLFEFQLILPEDEAELNSRAEALTLWVQGFLTGLKLANITIENRAPGEVTEAINDLIEIANMNYEEVVPSEEDEAAYMELVEYVRMAIILIYQELRPDESSAQTSNRLH